MNNITITIESHNSVNSAFDNDNWWDIDDPVEDLDKVVEWYMDNIMNYDKILSTFINDEKVNNFKTGNDLFEYLLRFCREYPKTDCEIKITGMIEI